MVLGPQVYVTTKRCAGQEGEAGTRSQLGAWRASPIITDAETKPHNWFFQLLLRLLAREQLPSLLSPNLSGKLFSNRKRQIN